MCIRDRNNSKRVVLGIQHLFAMFGATVLVPTLTGLNVSVALVCAGIGTLIFHFVTGHKVPVFLGSSFAYIPAIQAACINNDPELMEILANDGISAVITDERYLARIPFALGGIVVAGAVYCLMSLVVRLVGVERVRSFFPPVVTLSLIHIYPEGCFYSRVKPEDIKEIVDEHFLKGRIVKRLLYQETVTEDGVKSLNETNFYRKQLRVALRNCGVKMCIRDRLSLSSAAASPELDPQAIPMRPLCIRLSPFSTEERSIFASSLG